MKRTSTVAIVIHNTASGQGLTPDAILAFHLSKWSKGGYHIIYGVNERKHFYDWKDEATNGILPNGHLGLNNANVINLCYIGGVQADGVTPLCNITDFQLSEMIKDIEQILKWFPRARIFGHNQINITACPSFWVPDSVIAQRFPNNVDKREVFGNRAEIRRIANRSNVYDLVKQEEKEVVASTRDVSTAIALLEQALKELRK